MSSRWRSGITRTFGARIAAWYFGLFVASALVVVIASGLLLSASLARRDRDALLATLIRYTDAYVSGGVSVLNDVIAADRAAASYEPVFVRVLAGGRTRILSMPVEWTRFDIDRLGVPAIGDAVLQDLDGGDGTQLEVASTRLADGTLFQVGRTTTRRAQFIDRYRESATALLVLVLAAGLGGGILLTTRALQPVRDLTDMLTRILQTGRTDERIAVRGTHDPLDALGGLVNRMLDRIDRLVSGMRSSLDTVAHDLRTPMTRLRGTAEVALQTGRTADDFRNALADCVEEADRVTGLLGALMDLAEAETGAMRLRREHVDVVGVVRNALELYTEVAEEKGVALTLDEGPGTPRITGDAVRLTQVFANLVDNAVKYTPAPGRVTVTTAPAGDGVEVVVDDTGPGIAAEDQERIWDRLYRGDQSRSQRGLGIGLSLVRAIVAAHGGQTRVNSTQGQGARFVVWLPREMTQM